MNSYTIDSAISNLAHSFTLSKLELKECIANITLAGNSSQRFFFLRSLTLNKNIQKSKLELPVDQVEKILQEYYHYHSPIGMDTIYLPYVAASTFARKHTSVSYAAPPWMRGSTIGEYLDIGLFPVYRSDASISQSYVGNTLFSNFLEYNPDYLFSHSEKVFKWFFSTHLYPQWNYARRMELKQFMEKCNQDERLEMLKNIRQWFELLPYVRNTIDGDIEKKIKSTYKKKGLSLPNRALYPIGFDYLAASMGLLSGVEPIKLWS